MIDDMKDLLHMRDFKVCGVGPWLWPRADKWAWDLPGREFPGLCNKLLAHVRVRNRIVQAGGCCGMYPKLFAQYFKTVYTFEPDPINFYCLSANCASSRIVKIQAALGESSGFSDQLFSPDNAGGHKFISGTTGEGWIPMLRVDDFNFPDLDVIQLDCEGYEPQIIAGAKIAIARHHPVICIGTDSAEGDALLKELSYVEVDRQDLWSMASPPDRIFVSVTDAR